MGTENYTLTQTSKQNTSVEMHISSSTESFFLFQPQEHKILLTRGVEYKVKEKV